MGFGADSATLPEGLRRLVGAPDQLVAVERLVHDEGPGRGTPVLVVHNPGGISFEVLLDRAMDLGWAHTAGMPLAWRSHRGTVASSRHEVPGRGWTRTFGGGLLSTCGLASTGMPSEVDGVDHGMHGRIGHIPAENVRCRLAAEDGELSVEVVGDVVESALGHPTLALRRRIVAATTRPELCVEDTVINRSFEPARHMFRHHLNLGYPLIGPGTVVSAAAAVIGRRDATDAPCPALPWVLNVAATAPADETVLYCRPEPGPTCTTTVTAASGARLHVEQTTDAFPLLVLWRDPSPGVNVLGVEPSTSRDAGRAQAERDGEVVSLAPGESRAYRTRLWVRP
jgi:hypothetical protein